MGSPYNQLINESSPYLLQHAKNPVNWYPWNKETLKKAITEQKLMLISIGYSACHWCHVMEKESFKDSEVASLMNDNFICIKVDKEERPDIDLIYMEAVQLITGQGGWPLNCFATPDGKPFYGGTYFNKKQWTYVLNQIASLYKNDKGKIATQAEQLTKALSQNEFINLKKPISIFLEKDRLQAINNWKDKLDPINGGLLGQQKFPLPCATNFLLSYFFLANDKEIYLAITTQLDKMLNGGIYDQIEGGFSRYTVDKKWVIPHFEKMLYDNAQLLSTYSKAFLLTQNSNYQNVIEETINFLNNEMQAIDGLYYCALDADSDGVEGKYYVWSDEEFSSIIKNDFIYELYNISQEGNWENGENILHITQSKKDLTTKYNLNENQVDELIKASNKKLLLKRKNRIRPALDDKIITSWNALLIIGFIDAYNATKNTLILKNALNMGEIFKDYIIKNDGCVLRSFKVKNNKINGFLDDYAFTIQAFISLYTATFDHKWLTQADLLLEHTLSNFSDEKSNLFYYTSAENDSLIARKMELTDNVIPSSNSQMAINLYLIGQYFQKQEYIKRASLMCEYIYPFFKENGAHYANWGLLMNWLIEEPYQLAIVGKNALELKNKITSNYLPNIILLGSESTSELPLLKNKFKKGETYVYICRENTCLSPLTSIEKVVQIVNHSN